MNITEHTTSISTTIDFIGCEKGHSTNDEMTVLPKIDTIYILLDIIFDVSSVNMYVYN